MSRSHLETVAHLESSETSSKIHQPAITPQPENPTRIRLFDYLERPETPEQGAPKAQELPKQTEVGRNQTLGKILAQPSRMPGY